MKDKKHTEKMTFINKETGEEFEMKPLSAELVNQGNFKLPSQDIIFMGKDDLEILRLKENGDILVKGKLIENDSEVVDGLREFLSSYGVR